MDHKMTDRVLVGFGHNIFNLLPEIVVVYKAYIKIYVNELWKKCICTLFFFKISFGGVVLKMLESD